MNEVEEGGETSFPRWLNGETSEQLKVKPEIGKAILFYSVLPDGNYDERSQHAALPVIKGEKWLTNLWVWVSIVPFFVCLFVCVWEDKQNNSIVVCLTKFSSLYAFSNVTCSQFCQDPFMH